MAQRYDPATYPDESVSPFLLFQHEATEKLFRLQTTLREPIDTDPTLMEHPRTAAAHIGISILRLPFDTLQQGTIEEIEAHYFAAAADHSWIDYSDDGEMKVEKIININKAMDRVAALCNRGNGWVIMVNPADVDWLTSENPSEHTRWVKTYDREIRDWKLEATNTQYSCHIWSCPRIEQGMLYSAYRARSSLIDGIVVGPADENLYYYDPDFPSRDNPYIVKVALPKRS